MRLSFSGAPEVAAALHVVWPRIVDPHFVARHGPGVESVEVLDPQHFRVISGFGVGSIKLRFGIDVELIEVIPTSRLTMKARGKAPGSADAAPPAESSAPPRPTDPGPEGAPPNRVA